MAGGDLLARVAAALAPIEQVRAAWVFGSQVRGATHPRSDLDVAVVLPRELDARARDRVRVGVVSALAGAVGRLGEGADVVDLDECSSSLAFRAVRDGRRVLARSEAERVAAEVRVMRRYDDDAPRRALYRRAAIEAGRRMAEAGR